MSENRWWPEWQLVCFECGSLRAVEGGNCAECYAPMVAVDILVGEQLTGLSLNDAARAIDG